MKRVVIFASGSGTNAENIIKYFNHTKTAKVVQVLSNNERAKVFDRCKKLNVSCLFFSKNELYESDFILKLVEKNADYLILAGFLWKIPPKIIKAFPNKIINIHPALLPKYGGKGMYGKHVHKAVINNKEKESGITIHFVNEKYDDGAIIFQSKTEINDNDTPETVALKIHELEQRYFPRIIEDVILETND